MISKEDMTHTEKCGEPSVSDEQPDTKKIAVVGNDRVAESWARKQRENPRLNRSAHLMQTLAMAMTGMGMSDIYGYPFKNPLEPKQIKPETEKCMLPGCDNIRTRGKLYCSGDHCREHNRLLKEERKRK